MCTLLLVEDFFFFFFVCSGRLSKRVRPVVRKCYGIYTLIKQGPEVDWKV